MRRRFRGAGARAMLALFGLLLGAGCGRRDASIEILRPGFGPASLEVEIALGSGFVEGSLRVRMDGELVSDAFERTAIGAAASLPADPGVHTLVATGRFRRRFLPVLRTDAYVVAVPAGAPALLSSDPAAGAGHVPRSAWLRLAFDGAVPTRALRTFALECDGSPVDVDLHRLSPEVVVVNPAPELPGGAACALAWTGPDGVAAVSFSTAAAGLAAAQLLYDRDDPRRTAPYPDDLFLAPDASTATGLRHAMPVPEGPEDLMRIFASLLAEANQLDGFSPIGHMVVEFSDPVDPGSVPHTPAESLDPLATVALFDLAPGPAFGRRVPFRTGVRSDTGVNGATSHILLVYPSIPLSPGGRYGLVVTRRVLADPTRPFDASPFFAAALGDPLPGESAAVAGVRDLAGEVLEATGAATPPIPAEDVALALRITVRSVDAIPRDLLHMKQVIVEAPLPELELTSCRPIQDASCLASSDPASPVAGCLFGTFRAIEWRREGNLDRDEQGLPVPVRNRRIPFIAAFPKAAAGARVPVVMYQHGNPGSAQREVPGQARRYLAEAGFAVAGFTDNLNRELSPGQLGDIAIQAQVFGVLAGIMEQQKIPDFWHQTNAEQMTFLRALEALANADVSGFCAGAGVAGVPDLDPEAPQTYVGISQGANHAPALLAYSPEIRAAAMIVGGGRLAETLIHQAADTILPQLGVFFPSLTPADTYVGFSIFQADFDRQDAHNHARYLYREPIPVLGSTKKPSILFVEGLEDTLVPNNASDSLAWLIGPLPHLEPVQRAVPFLAPVAGPVVANVDAETTAAFYQYVPVGVDGIAPTPGCTVLSPGSASEGHYCAQSAAESLRQRSVFLQSALSDVAPRIIDPLSAP